MRPGFLIALAGFILLIASTWSPLLRPFHIFNWNVYDLNKTYGIVLLLVAITGAAGAVLGKLSLTKYAAFVAVILVVLLYAAALMKVKTSFSFIPFKTISAYLSNGIQFKWGWLLMFSSALVALIGVLSVKRQFTHN